MKGVSHQRAHDLWIDPNSVGGDLVVECWISHGPRANDVAFDPQPGDSVWVGDDDEEPHPARVFRREGDRVWVQVLLSTEAGAVAWGQLAREHSIVEVTIM
jgi:hypothetical protein